MKYSFSRKTRLTTGVQFKQVFRKGKKTTYPTCAIFCCFNTLQHSRLGVVVPKKSIKKSVERNCFKRVVREGFRLKQHDLGNLDIVVLAYKQAEGVGKEKVRLCLEQLWEMLVLRHRKP
jgi:ribonuclease P protein component